MQSEETREIAGRVKDPIVSSPRPDARPAADVVSGPDGGLQPTVDVLGSKPVPPLEAEESGRRAGAKRRPRSVWDRIRSPFRRSRPKVEPETFRQHLVVFAKELAVVVVAAIVVASLVRAFVAQPFLIPSSSMENILIANDRVMVEKITAVKRGEVVVFKDPGGWVSNPNTSKPNAVSRGLQFLGVLPDRSTDHLIKRVIGLPGDHVICCDEQGRITVNGQSLDETSYLYRASDGTQVAASLSHWDVIVPTGHIFVLGDHRDASRDSRCHLADPNDDPNLIGANAFIARDDLVGRARRVLWPSNRMHSLGIPASFATVPPAAGPAPATAQIQVRPEFPC